MWRSVLLILGLCGVLAGCSWDSGAVSQAPPTAFNSGAGLVGQHRYSDHKLGWMIRYPARFRVGRFSSTCCMDMGAQGDWLANFNADIRGGPVRVGTASTVPDMTHLRAFPPNGVALAIWQTEGGLQARVTGKPTTVPIQPAALQPVAPYVGGSEPAPRFAVIYVDGKELGLAVWIGPHASKADRNAIWATLATLHDT
jgi:hypothetical protein